jgi:CII-binding regulator of phage lambda lysogenization HflD
MEAKQFTQEELDQIKGLQEKYNALGIQLVQLKLALNNAESYMKTLKEQETQIEDQIIQVNTEEKKLAQDLDTKYGAGSLDLESGVFTPKS